MTAASDSSPGPPPPTVREGYSAPEPALRIPGLKDDQRLLHEVFLLLFCAAFAAAVFFFWHWLKGVWIDTLPPDQVRTTENLKDLLGPFLTAYVAARLYSTMVRRYERQLQRGRSMLASILNESVDAILTMDVDDRIMTWNRGATQIFGYTEEEVLGRHAADLFPDRPAALEELQRIRETVERDGVLRAYEADRVSKDGRHIRAEITCTALRDTRGRYAGRAAILRDVTERDRMRAELLRQESLAAVGEMAAAIAHEVKNPLAGISGAVKVIGRDFDPQDPRTEVVEEIQRQVLRLDAIIRDLLSFARPTVPRFARIELREFVGRVLRGLREVPVLERHDLETRIPEGLELRADPQLLENILINLLLNAAEALGERRGHIVVEAGERNGLSCVEVRDDGPGMPEAVVRSIFKPFFTTKHRGTGLGLTIVRKLVEVMGGRVELETEEGKGTRFAMLLPKEQG